MEILKRAALAAFIILLAAKSQAQTAGTVIEKAFRNSYNNEYRKNYSAAISDISPYYSDDNYEVTLRLGWLYFLSKNYANAQTYYARAVKLRPNAIEAKFGYIKPLALQENWERVLDQYNDILKIDPQNTQANYWTGVIYYNRKQYETAARYFIRVISLYPFDYDGNHMLAWSYLMAGKKPEAKAYFVKALIIKPDDASSTDGLNRCK